MSPIDQALVIVGLPCAGKTTGGLIIQDALGYEHYEASDVIWRHFRASPTARGEIDDFAARVLAKTPDIVPRAVVAAAVAAGRTNIVITGFRSPRELHALRAIVGNVRVVFVHAPPNLRYVRAIKRGRGDVPSSREAFCARDKSQRLMGADRLRRIQSVLRVANIGSLAAYRTALLDVLKYENAQT